MTYALNSLSPNPFNPSTTISFQLPVSGHVNVTIYDISGRLVETLVNGWRAAGDHQVIFEGQNLASGIYFVRLKAGNFAQAKKMVMLK